MSPWQPPSAPRPADAAKAREGWEALCEDGGEAKGDKGPRPDEASARPLVEGLCGNSPFLAHILRQQPGFGRQLFALGPDRVFADLIAGLPEKAAGATDQGALGLELRQTRARIALTVAAADVSGAWTLDQVTRALSDFADLTLDLALSRLLFDRMECGDIAWPHEALAAPHKSLLEGCGLVLVAMGKLGGRELNYSSDIDLIALYDEARVGYRGRRTPGDCFVRLIQDLVTLLARRTAEGFVFRTDFRLRPDPGSTPLAVSLNAAETYYQSTGKNWERSALIKARPCAGDLRVGERFLGRIRPFIWRRSLDYAAIEDIHAIKSQVHDFHHHGRIAAREHDIKIGRGGIREIEFFAQIHQLIAGGRDPDLRSRRTLEALPAIARAGKISREAADELSQAYIFLRTLENRLQMIADEQTHKIPADDENMERLACLMHFEDTSGLEEAMLGHLTNVSQHYEQLPGGGDEDSEGTGFQITDDALPDYLASLGFADIVSSANIVSAWRSGRYRALRYQRARKLLDRVLERLLEEFGRASDPDRALSRFDRFLSQLPSGVQLFSLFNANPWLFQLLSRIMSSAPLLAEHLGRRPQLLDSVLDPDFFDPLPETGILDRELDAALALGRDYQDALDIFRRWLNDRRFGIGVQILTGASDIPAAGKALADLADATLRGLLPVVQRDFESRYGRFPGHGLALIAMGSYGGCELTYTSDLDLILLYHADPDCEASDGPRPLAPSLYFSRLGQHLVTALSALTGEGRLYEIDLRLRPSGRKGPLVVTLETFEDYQTHSAWTWEHMALTRARIVHAGEQFARAVEKSIAKTLRMERRSDELARAVIKMRHRLQKEYGTDNPFAVRYVRGGLVDIEFICQYLLLREGHRRPELFDSSLTRSLDNLAAAGVLDAGKSRQLIAAHRLQSIVRGLTSICFSGDPREEELSHEIRELMTRLSAQPDFATLKRRIDREQAMVYSLYRDLLRSGEQVE